MTNQGGTAMDAFELRKMYPHVKPNTLVYVDLLHTKGYAHTGEVMSFPTPEGTAMVRRVPGHAGTLEEVPLECLKEAQRARRTVVHYAVVKGRGSFPVDMLRYDCAAPVNFRITEEGKVERIEDAAMAASVGEDDLVIATARSGSPHEVWTKDRWASFLWTVERLGEDVL